MAKGSKATARTPIFHDALFAGGENERKHARVLDVHNALVHMRDKPEWKAIKDAGMRAYTWQADDSLADMFLIQLGDYPSAEETGIDYREILRQAIGAIESPIETALPIPADVLYRPSSLSG